MHHKHILGGLIGTFFSLTGWGILAQGVGPSNAFYGQRPEAFGRPVYRRISPVFLDTIHPPQLPFTGRVNRVAQTEQTAVVPQQNGPMDAGYWNDRIELLPHADVLLLMPYLLLHAPSAAFNVPLIPPLFADQPHRYTSGFGWRRHPVLGGVRHHAGIDIAGPPQPVKATAGGLIRRVAYEPGYGLFIVIDHGNSYETLYGHLAASFVQIGDVVTVGQPIATLGRSGRVTGYHLHYAVKKSGVFLDPVGYLVAATQFIARYQPQLAALKAAR